MPDLANRISEGAVSVLELVAHDKRFAELSTTVLRGGAERFRAVVVDDEPIRYVLPVGVPDERLDFGTLLVQATRVSLVWRPEQIRPYRAVVCALGPGTEVSQTAVPVRGETWGRFDLRDGSASMTFLVPPVSTPDLPAALHAALISDPGSTIGRFATAALAPAVTETSPAHFPVAPPPRVEPVPAEEPTAEVSLPSAVRRPVVEASETAPVVDPGPAPAPPQPTAGPVGAASPAPVPTVPHPDRRPLTGPDTTRGFVIGLLGTIGLGALFLLLRLFGG